MQAFSPGKQICFCILFLLASNYVRSQAQISLSNVAQHIGDSVSVCGKVYGANFLKNIKTQPTLINLGGTKANERILIRVRIENRSAYHGGPEAYFLNKQICFTGRITKENGFEEIILNQTKGITVVEPPSILQPLAKDNNLKFNSKIATPTLISRRQDSIILHTNVYVLTGPSWNEQIVTFLKKGSLVSVSYSIGKWSYVRIKQNIVRPYENENIFGFINNTALGIKRKGML